VEILVHKNLNNGEIAFKTFSDKDKSFTNN